MKIISLCLLTLIIGVSGVLPTANAQATRRDDGDATKAAASAAAASAAKAQQALQDMTNERDALQKEKSKLQAEVVALKAKTAAMQGQVNGLQTNIEGTNTLIDRFKQRDASWQERLDQQRAKMQEVVEKFKEVAQNLRTVESERSEFRVKHGVQEKELLRCVDNNIKLYKIGVELIEQYENKSIWDSLFQHEPITRIKKVELETQVQDYMLKLKEGSVVPVQP